MSTETTRDALLEKRRKIDAQIKAIDAKRRAQKRKDETRAKIIVGSVVMAEAQSDALFMQRLASLIDKHAGEKDQAFLAPLLAKLSDQTTGTHHGDIEQGKPAIASEPPSHQTKESGVLPAP